MERPTKVDIFGIIWRIEWCPIVRDAHIFGDTADQNLTIRIDNALEPQQEKVTLLHELHHAIQMSLGATDDNDPHRGIYTNSQGLWAVAKHNPDLWQWLWSEEDTEDA